VQKDQKEQEQRGNCLGLCLPLGHNAARGMGDSFGGGFFYNKADESRWRHLPQLLQQKQQVQRWVKWAGVGGGPKSAVGSFGRSNRGVSAAYAV